MSGPVTKPGPSAPSGSLPSSRPGSGPASAANPAGIRPIGISRGRVVAGQKVGIYGPGGVGKTELCALIEQIGIVPVFCDVEDSSKFLDVVRADPAPTTLEELRAFLHTVPAMQDVGAVVIDSATKVEEFCATWVVANVKHPEKPEKTIRGIEDYGFGKGYIFIFEAFLQILGDLDACSRAGKHVLMTMHDCTATVPNPRGEDWLRYEPRLQSPPSGKGSVRHRVKEWVDHLLYVGFDVNVDSDGKATPSAVRTIYANEQPNFWAKSRTLEGIVKYSRGSAELWEKLFNVNKA